MPWNSGLAYVMYFWKNISIQVSLRLGVSVAIKGEMRLGRRDATLNETNFLPSDFQFQDYWNTFSFYLPEYIFYHCVNSLVVILLKHGFTPNHVIPYEWLSLSLPHGVFGEGAIIMMWQELELSLNPNDSFPHFRIGLASNQFQWR